MAKPERKPPDVADYDPGRCGRKVWHRDTYRSCGRNRRFELEYTPEQCSRKAGPDGRCWQHRNY